MSLATRCPACGTIFRVVQDQLKVSEGWVRCGQCHEVFHGIEHLFDLESDPTLAARRAAARGSTPVADTGEDSVPGFAPTRTPPIGSARRAGLTSSGPAPVPASSTAPPPRAPVPPPPPAPTTVRPPAAAPAPSPAAPVPPAAPVSAPMPLSAPPAQPPGPLRRFMPAPTAEGAPVPAPVPFTPSPPPGPFERTEVLPPIEPPHEPEAPESLPAIVEPPAPSPAPVDFELSAPLALIEPAPEPAPTPVAEPTPVPASPPAADAEATTLPSRLADDAGPETLASLLPEPPGEWPPRKKSSRRPKDKDRQRGATARGREADAERERERAAAREAETALPEAPTEDHPRFVREARSSAFWNSPTMRAGLGLALILLGLGAVGQVAWPMRDTLAVHYPSTAPVFQTLCEQLGCTLQAPRALASLTLDGSSLTRTETDHVLLFSADLRNRSPWATRTPAFDLKFTDLGGQVVARRVFQPADLGITQAALGPDAELHVHARLRLDGIDVVGFQAEVFYP